MFSLIDMTVDLCWQQLTICGARYFMCPWSTGAIKNSINFILYNKHSPHRRYRHASAYLQWFLDLAPFALVITSRLRGDPCWFTPEVRNLALTGERYLALAGELSRILWRMGVICDILLGMASPVSRAGTGVAEWLPATVGLTTFQWAHLPQ